MAPRKKNLHKRQTVKVSYAVLYTRENDEEKPQEPQEREEAIREAAEKPEPVGAEKRVPKFARNKKK